MRPIGWLLLLISCSVQLFAVFSVARWQQPPLDAQDLRLPVGPNAPRQLRRLLQLRGVFLEQQSDAQPADGLDDALAVKATGMPSSVDRHLALFVIRDFRRRILTVHSSAELRREVNLGLRRMWVAYATWSKSPEFEPRLAAALEAFGCRLALLPCAATSEMTDFCVERGFAGGRAGLVVTHPDSTGLQDVVVAFLPSADPSAVLARLAPRVSGLLTDWRPSDRSAAAAGEAGLLAELPAWPPSAPLMLAALSVEFHGRLHFWRRRPGNASAAGGSALKLTLLTPERDYPLAAADSGTSAALQLLLASVAPDTWQAGWIAAALLNFALLPLPSLQPGAAFSTRSVAALKLAIWCNLLLLAGLAALRLFFSAAWASPVGLALAAAWRRLVLSDLALRIRADWHLGAYPSAGLTAVTVLVWCAFCWSRPLQLEDPEEAGPAPVAGLHEAPSANLAAPLLRRVSRSSPASYGNRVASAPASLLDAAAASSAPAAGAARARNGQAERPQSAQPDAVSSSGSGSSSSISGGVSSGGSLGSSSSSSDADEEEAAARDAEAAQSLELFIESLAIPSLWIPQRDPERCLSRLQQWTCRVTAPGAPSDSTATATADTDADVDGADSGGDGWPAAAIRSSHCPVCLDRFRRGHQLVCLLCGHVFHRGCAADWLMRRSTCPVCRRCPYRLAPPAAGSVSGAFAVTQ